MSSLITALTSLFSFLISAMGDIADFFTNNLIGQIILGIGLFSVVINIVMIFINKLRG